MKNYHYFSWAVILAGALCACVVDDLQVVNRFCETTAQCGPGTVCDQLSKKCVVDNAIDGGRGDGKDGGTHGDGKSHDAADPLLPSFVSLSAGEFTMGSLTSELCRENNETQHQVTLTHGFEIMTTEITQKSFLQLMGYNPTYFTSCGENCPVENVSWSEVAAYCNALSTRRNLTPCYSCTGSGTNVVCEEASAYYWEKIYNCLGYRLPTEAEWEYAYRAGSAAPLYSGKPVVTCNGSDANANEISWNQYNSNSVTHPVGGKTPNAIGLYDMAGNVWEWANDYWIEDLGSGAVVNPYGGTTAPNVVIRGGSSLDGPYGHRAAYRYGYFDETKRYYDVGGRCVRSKY